MTKKDILIVRSALTATRNIARAHQSGGLHDLWSQLRLALEALDRIETVIVNRQLPLPMTSPLNTDSADYKRNT